MTQSELGDWKRHPVTQEIMYVLNARREGLKDLLTTADEMAVIKFNQGYIAALNDFLDIEPEEESHGS